MARVLNRVRNRAHKSAIERASVENKRVSGLRAIQKRRAATSGLSQVTPVGNRSVNGSNGVGSWETGSSTSGLRLLLEARGDDFGVVVEREHDIKPRPVTESACRLDGAAMAQNDAVDNR